jgi:hypothetical protein
MMDERGPNLIQVKLRMSKSLHRKLTREVARRQGQTIGAEMIRRLEASFASEDVLERIKSVVERLPPPDAVQQMLSRLDHIDGWISEQRKKRETDATASNAPDADAPKAYNRSFWGDKDND